MLVVAVLLETPCVPDGGLLRARYPKRPEEVEPQFSEGKPGQVWLQSEVEVVSPGAESEHQQLLPWTMANAYWLLQLSKHNPLD